MSTQIRWRAVRQPGDTADVDLIDCEVVEAFNRYATRATLWFEDPDGTKESTYSRGQRVELEYSTDGGSTWTRRYAGVVITPTPVYDAGAQSLKVETYGYDHFLRRQGIYETYTSQTLTSILQDIVEDYTPLTWDAGNVSTVNNPTITREFRGEKPDVAIAWLLSQSADEEFGANRDFEFFVRERDTERSPVDIDDSGFYDYDLPTEGAAAVNFVRVFYGSGGSESFITVQDRVSQRELKDSLDAPRNVVISAEATYPEISSKDAAKAKAREILDNRVPIRTGYVRTFGRFLMEAGDVFRLTISDASIDTDYRVAQITYRWRRMETEVVVAENRGEVSALLVELSDDVDRIDARAADPTASGTEVLDFDVGVEVTVTGSAETTTTSAESFDAGAYGTETFSPFDPTSTTGFTLGTTTTVNVAQAAATNAAVNMFRDTWSGDAATSITHIAVGTGSKAVSQADTTLDNEVGRFAVDGVTASGSFAIDLTGTLTAGGELVGEPIREFGFFDASSGGDMYVRCVLEQSTEHSPVADMALEARLTIDTDESDGIVGVVTDSGKTALRDTFLGDTVDEPNAISIGTGTTAETEADTSLGTEIDWVTATLTDGSVGVVTFAGDFGTAENNGSDISEVGLRYEGSPDSDEYVRVTFQAISKTSSFDLTLELRFRIRAVPTIS